MIRTARRRQAIILVLVLIMFFVMALFIAGLSTQVMHSHRSMRNHWQREQAWWLAQSELDRYALLVETGQAEDQSRTMTMDGRAYQIDAKRSEAANGVTTLSVLVSDPSVDPPRAIMQRSLEVRVSDTEEPSNNES